jgi:hypothetical protein
MRSTRPDPESVILNLNMHAFTSPVGSNQNLWQVVSHSTHNFNAGRDQSDQYLLQLYSISRLLR